MMNAACDDTGARSAEFGHIVALTHVMLEKAQAGEWAEVMRMELDRQQRIQEFFSTDVGAEENGRIADGIREILAIDRRITDLGRQYLDGLSTEINELQAGRRASQAYSDIGG